MSYDYEMYDGKRIAVDGVVIGLLAMEFGREVEEVWEEYHGKLAMTEEQERQSEAYKESLRRTLSAQYEKVDVLEAENAKLRERIGELEELTDDERYIPQEWYAQLKAENSKLRELVWTLANCAAGHGCDYCTINGGYGYVGEHDMCESVHDRMRELGVEVRP